MEEPSCYLKHSTRRRRKTPKCMEMEMLMVPYIWEPAQFLSRPPSGSLFFFRPCRRSGLSFNSLTVRTFKVRFVCSPKRNNIQIKKN